MVCMGKDMVKCDICGKDVPEDDAKHISMGSITKVICFKCYKQGQKEVTSYQIKQWSKINRQDNRRSE